MIPLWYLEKQDVVGYISEKLLSSEIMATEIISYEFYRIIFELFKIPNENVIECY